MHDTSCIFLFDIRATLLTSSPIWGTKGERRGMVSIIHDGGSHSSASSPAREDVGFWVHTICWSGYNENGAAGQHSKDGAQLMFSTKTCFQELQVVLAHLFGLLGFLPLLIFLLLGLFRLVITLFLLRAAVALRLYGPPGWSFGRLEVDPGIGSPIGIFTGGITENKKGL